MSHIYQPVMLRELLTRGGEASVQQIARALLAEDRSQVEYYERIATGMVGPVLTRRSIATKELRLYRLNGAHQLSDPERQTLIDLCDAKIRSSISNDAPTRGHTGESQTAICPAHCATRCSSRQTSVAHFAEFRLTRRPWKSIT